MTDKIILQAKPSIFPTLTYWLLAGVIGAIPLLMLAAAFGSYVQVMGTIFAGLALLFFMLCVARMFGDLISREFTTYTLTDTYLIKEAGIFNRDQSQIPLTKVQGTQIQWPLAGQILDYGNVIITTAGRTYIKLYSVPQPRRWERKIVERTE